MNPADVLRAEAALRPPEGLSPQLTIAFAQHQESVFRAIDVLIRRGAPAHSFDQTVSEVVESIPDTLVGPVAMCNAQIRATVAVLRTALRVVGMMSGSSATKGAVLPLFDALNDGVSPWRNPGIAEGCFHALPALLRAPMHDDLTAKALEALFRHLERPADVRVSAHVHVHLASASCFRRILVALAILHSESHSPAEEARLENDIATIFANPSPRAVFAAFRNVPLPVAGRRSQTSDLVIAGTAFDTALLNNSDSVTTRWPALEPEEQVLFVRTVALQLKAATGEWRDIERFPILRRHYARLSSIWRTATEREISLWTLLANLPSAAAESIDAEIQAFVEHSEQRSAMHHARADALEGLPDYVLAMVSPAAGNRITDLIVREIDRKLLHARAHDASFDLGSLLYEVLLRDPHESLFEHLLPRLAYAHDRDVTLLFRDLSLTVLRSITTDDSPTVYDLLNLADQHLHKARLTTSRTVASLAGIFDLYKRLVSDKETVWVTLTEEDMGGLGALFAAFDDLLYRVSDHLPRRPALAPECRDRLVDLQSEVEFYQRLPIDEFEIRARTLERAREIADELLATLRENDQMCMAEHVFLVTVVHHLRSFFDRTIRWYCQEPRRKWKEGAHDSFWALFAAESREQRWTSSGDSRKQFQQIVTKAGPQPPPYPGQRRRFEKFFVRWLSSEIDAEALARALRPRWPAWFDSAFTMMTSFYSIALLILVPSMFAIAMHERREHDFEGGGFFLVYVALILVTIFTLSRTGRLLSLRLRGGPALDARPVQYRFECMFPRVAGFIAAPMALIVEFEHAYQFPLKASDSSLLLLMILAVLAIRFTVTHAVAAEENAAGSADGTDRRVNSIVAVALAQSFVIALLLSMIFAGHVDVPAPGPQAAVHESPHHLPHFLGILPREVTLDIPSFASRHGIHFVPVAEHFLHFVFYPTIILTWTALGVLFGVVFEGFLKGAKMRGEGAQKSE